MCYRSFTSCVVSCQLSSYGHCCEQAVQIDCSTSETLYFHDKPPKQTLWRVKTPCKHFTRSQIHGHTYRPQALELLLQNKLQDVTDARYHNSINFTVTQQNCTQQKVAVKLTAENVLLFFKLGENRKNKTRNMHTLKSIQKL